MEQLGCVAGRLVTLLGCCPRAKLLLTNSNLSKAKSMVNPSTFKMAIIVSAIFFNMGPTAYFRSDVSQDKMNLDYDGCKISGLRDAPPDRVNGIDNNFDFRVKLIGRCMAQKGYKTVKRRTCGPFRKPNDMSKPAILTDKTCIYGGGSYYAFVN
jgi:hypothetical protein